MKRALSIALVSAFAFASTPSFSAELTQDVKVQLKELTKQAGAGEISSKEYNKRKQEILASAGAQQTAESNKK